MARGALTSEALPAAAEPGEAAASGAIDTIFLNGTFLLAEPTIRGETVTAVARSGAMIVDVGDAARIIRSAPKAKQIDLNKTTLAPGFIEPHAHIIAAVQFNYSVDLGYSNCSSYERVLARIATAVQGASPGDWLFFVNFDPSLLGFTEGVGFPQLGFSAFASIPGAQRVNIFVENASGHLAYANATAFATVGVTAGTPPPPGGGSYQVIDGQLTGVMFEPPTFTKFLAKVPTQTTSQVVLTMMGFLSTAQKAGITTVADPAVGISGDLAGELSLYQYIATAINRSTDVVGSLDISALYAPGGRSRSSAGSLVTPPSRPGGTGWYGGLTIPAVKLWADGSTQGYTGYLTEPYRLPVTPVGLGDHGAADWSLADMTDLLTQARADNWSTLVHANGDAGLDLALNAIRGAYGANLGSGFRHRIEHCTVTRPEQYATMRSMGVTPSYLNNHVYIWGDTFNENILGNERAARLDAAGDAVAQGMIFSFHCDYATSMPQPLRYMQTAVTRQTSSGTVLGSKYAITPLEALKGVTIYPAQQLGIDASVGTIAAGKRANFVNLAADPLAVAADTIATIKVLGTYLGSRWMPV